MVVACMYLRRRTVQPEVVGEATRDERGSSAAVVALGSQPRKKPGYFGRRLVLPASMTGVKLALANEH
jgi:hypothetical protein